MLQVVAFRHGETTLNAAGRLTGQLDPPLTVRGRDQARALAGVLHGPFDRRIHSGLARAAQTLALAGFGAGAEAEPRFAERSFGTLEGAPRSAWRQPDDLDAAPPGGESFRQLGARVVGALDDLAAAGGASRVLLSGHSGVLRWLIALAAGSTDLKHFTGPGPANGAVVVLDYAAPSTPTLLSD